MPDNIQRTEFQIAWLNFTDSVKLILLPQIDDRPLDQYLLYRDKVLDLVKDEQFLSDLQYAWDESPFPDSPDWRIKNILLLEIQSFSRAVEVGRATEEKEEPQKWYYKWLCRAGVVSDSVKEILTSLSPFAKNGLILFKEMVDLFTGKA